MDISPHNCRLFQRLLHLVYFSWNWNIYIYYALQMNRISCHIPWNGHDAIVKCILIIGNERFRAYYLCIWVCAVVVFFLYSLQRHNTLINMLWAHMIGLKRYHFTERHSTQQIYMYKYNSAMVQWTSHRGYKTKTNRFPHSRATNSN